MHFIAANCPNYLIWYLELVLILIYKSCLQVLSIGIYFILLKIVGTYFPSKLIHYTKYSIKSFNSCCQVIFFKNGLLSLQHLLFSELNSRITHNSDWFEKRWKTTELHCRISPPIPNSNSLKVNFLHKLGGFQYIFTEGWNIMPTVTNPKYIEFGFC